MLHLCRYRRPGRAGARGQSLVEFALVAPIMLFMMVAIVDFSRIYTAQLTVESAAREAADFGAFSSSNWSESNYAMTVAGMEERVCVASSELTDFVGSATSCTNPLMSPPRLTDKNDVDATGCDDPDRKAPCWVRVDLSYAFKVVAPLGFDFFGVRLGFPSTLTFTRTSIFAISDFKIDQKPPKP